MTLGLGVIKMAADHLKPNVVWFMIMPTILRVRGFEVRVFNHDHRPPHVHVYRGTVSIVIALSPVEIVRKQGRPTRAEVRTALDIVATYRELCLAAFERYSDA
jgi:hypothetical protein